MKHILLILPFVFFKVALSQDSLPSIITDRPDWTESSFTVPHKTFQIESGFTFTWDKQDGVETRDLGYNSTLLRYGLLSRLELRLGVAFAGTEIENEITGEKQNMQGLVPLIVGIKWNFLHGNGPIPNMAFLANVSIPPLASNDFNDLNVMSRYLFAGSWQLSKVFSLGFNFGSLVDWKQSDFTTLYTSSLGISIMPWLGAFVELYGFLPAGEYSDHRFDAGLVFPVKHNLQFDISGGMGISKNSPDGFASFGFAWRIPQ